MGNGLCGSTPQVVPSYLVEQQVDCSRLVNASKARVIPFEGGGGSSSSSAGCKKQVDNGECLVLLEFVKDIPADGTGGTFSCEAAGSSKFHGHPYMKIWAEDADGQRIGRVAEWPAKQCNGRISWYSTQSLGISLSMLSSAKLRMELISNKTVIGSLAVPANEVSGHGVSVRELDSRPTGFPWKPSAVSMQVFGSTAVPKKHTVFFVRHGESIWNRAQAKMQVYEQVRTTDHGLSDKGREQAEALRTRLLSADKPQELGLAAGMLQPDVVYVSPLTRAVQTAIISLGQLLVKPDGLGELVLMPNAREKLNYGGFDSWSTKTGLDILQHAVDEIKTLYKGQDSRDDVLETFAKLRVDIEEVQDRWWCEGVAESPAQLQVRIDQFMTQLMYSPHNTAVVVGHSHFFRAVFKKYLSNKFKAERTTLAKCLSDGKLSNCGVCRVEVEVGPDGLPVITSAELVLNTTTIPDGDYGVNGCCTNTGVACRSDIDNEMFEDVKEEEMSFGDEPLDQVPKSSADASAATAVRAAAGAATGTDSVNR